MNKKCFICGKDADTFIFTYHLTKNNNELFKEGEGGIVIDLCNNCESFIRNDLIQIISNGMRFQKFLRENSNVQEKLHLD